jgi:hypothetical protein
MKYCSLTNWSMALVWHSGSLKRLLNPINVPMVTLFLHWVFCAYAQTLNRSRTITLFVSVYRLLYMDICFLRQWEFVSELSSVRKWATSAYHDPVAVLWNGEFSTANDLQQREAGLHMISKFTFVVCCVIYNNTLKPSGCCMYHLL